MYIIFPNDCLTSASGFIVGKRDEATKILCIVNIVPADLTAFLDAICKETESSILGYWCGYDFISLPQDSHFNLVLLQRQSRGIPKVLSSKEDDFVIILYKNLCSYSFLTTTALVLRSPALDVELDVSQARSVCYNCPPLPRITAESHTDEILTHVNNTMAARSKMYSILYPKRAKILNDLAETANHISILPRLCLKILISISSFLLWFFNLSMFQWKAVSFLMSLPVFLIQFSVRLSQFKFLGKYTGSPQLGIQQSANHGLNDKKNDLLEKQRIFILKGNVLATIILDVLLGILLVDFISSSTLITAFANNLVNYTDSAAQLLTQLINWLMGVPGGLKLNKTLTNFLGKFFLYHIYLWQTYLQVIQPYLKPVLQVCIMSGYLGMTFLISMASDIFSLLTLHIYFFYVYAARVYSLQIYAILSLARLFTGKKWNVLRNRVDSLPYDVDRLFIGTLLFTILLFLLPTTALFYVVFTTLRLLVLVFKSFLSTATHVLNKAPLFGLVLTIVKPAMLPGGLHIEINKPSTNDNTNHPSTSSPHLPPEVKALCIKLFNKSLSVSQLLDWSISSGHVISAKQDTWGAFVGKLLRGQLVYPWIERNE